MSVSSSILFRSLSLVFAVCCSWCFFAAGCSEKTPVPKPATVPAKPAPQPAAVRSLRDQAQDASLAVEGQKIFVMLCAQCHGVAGKGDGPAAERLSPRPRNFTSEKFRFGNDVASIYQTLLNGSPGTGMRSFRQLPPEKLFALVHFVRKFVPDPSPTTPEVLARLPGN